MITTLISIAMLAFADPTQAVSQRRVNINYADLNLNNAAGIAELDRRIQRAVDAVCSTSKSKLLAEVQAAEACRAEARNYVAAQREKALASARANNGTLASVR